MRAGAKRYDLDLSRMGDEALVILAQECAFRPATDELVLRYYERMNPLIARKARGLGLTADLPDAQQNAVFAILEAIAGYDTLEAARPRGCSFRTYLGRVVLARFGDFVRQLRRLRRQWWTPGLLTIWCPGAGFTDNMVSLLCANCSTVAVMATASVLPRA